MEKDKSRGLKHINNKQKYKGNSTKNSTKSSAKNPTNNSKTVPPKSKPVLDSNWDRYEYEDDDLESGLTDNKVDFSVLANAPLSRGKHFQFRNEKLVADEIKTDSTHSLFHLDLVKLEEGILSIPFFERVDIDENTFSTQQICVMKAEADEYYKKLMEKNKSSNSDSFLSEDDTSLDVPVQDTNFSEGEKNVKAPIVWDESDVDTDAWLEEILNG